MPSRREILSSREETFHFLETSPNTENITVIVVVVMVVRDI